MKANELRIGNWIKSDINLRKQIKVLQIFTDSCQGDFGDGSRGCIMLSNSEGITLTEEWLLKWGFDKIPHFTITNALVKDIGRNRILSVGCVATPNLMVFVGEINGNDITDITDLICVHNWDYDQEMYLHQFQNLYYTLTGKEL